MKKLLALALALVLTLAFTGCHGTLSSGENPAASSSYPVPDEFDTSRRYEVTFWAKNDTNMAQVNIYKQAIADFEALYPNITVNLRLYTDYGKIYNDVITNIATDTTPNVCITYPDHIATYLTGEDTVVPLDDLFADEKYGLGGSEVRFDSPTQAEITHQFLSECAINGHYYAIPYMRSTEACYVNKTYVEKLGYTLQGRLPSAPDEIVVTDYILEHFLKAGYVKAGETAAVPVSDADGLIGKTLKLYPGGQARTFTVCGVIRTGFDSTRYESLKNTDAGSGTTIIDYMTVQDLQQVLKNSYLALGFISEDAFASLKSESDVLPVYTDGYGAALYHPDLPLSAAGYLEYGKADGVQYRLPGSSGALSSDETLLPLQTLLEAEFDHNGQKLTGGMLFERYVSEALAELDGDPTVEEAIDIRSAAIARMLGDLPEMGSVQLEISDYAAGTDVSHELRVAGFYASYSDDAADYESASEVLSVLSANGGSGYAVLADGAAEALGLQRDGLYATAVGAMPEDRAGIEALVRFSIEEDSDGAAYPLGNNVSYVLAQIDSILTELADVFLYIGIAFAVFSALMLMNFISSSISAKKHEIGILRAVGARGSDVFGIFFNESMIIALINWVISTLFVFLSVAGINYFFRTEFNLAITVLVFGVLQMLLILAVSALTAFIASVIPVTKISRKKPIDAIRKR